MSSARNNTKVFYKPLNSQYAPAKLIESSNAPDDDEYNISEGVHDDTDDDDANNSEIETHEDTHPLDGALSLDKTNLIENESELTNGKSHIRMTKLRRAAVGEQRAKLTPIDDEFQDYSKIRRILVVVSLLLTIAFTLRLVTNRPTSIVQPTHNQTTTTSTLTEPLAAARISPNDGNEKSMRTQLPLTTLRSTGTKLESKTDPEKPIYDDYISSIVSQRQAGDGIATERLDDFYRLRDGDERAWWSRGYRNKHVTITNYIRAMKSFSHNSSVTLTTQSTTEFLHHSLELCKRWMGPLSVAVFGPGVEFTIAVTLIKFMRQCLPDPLSACVRDKITWHMVYPESHEPPLDPISFPRDMLDAQHYPLFVDHKHCPKLRGPEPSDLIQQFEMELRKNNGLYPRNLRQMRSITYPINVLRNTARLAATTHHVLASDIELYPSVNLVPSFVNYMRTHDITREYPHVKRYIFTLPIFEVKASVKHVPQTKRELVELMQKREAIFFHKYVCDACQNFPNRLEWLETDEHGHEDFHAGDDQLELAVFEVTQRDASHQFWEPIFIGTNDEPLYDDRLTWEGRRDKMGQMYEMCLQDYHLLVIGNAFLVHAPGIKHIDKEDTMKRLEFLRRNNAIYDETMSRLRTQYANSSNIHKC